MTTNCIMLILLIIKLYSDYNLPYVAGGCHMAPKTEVGLVIQWRWEAYHQNHNSAGFPAGI
jgi:hypothetical protein